MTDTKHGTQTTPALRLEEQLCLDLYVASRALIGAYRSELARHHLTYPQYLVLLALHEHGPRSVKQLSEHLCLDAGTLSPLLKRLESAGYIKRERHTSDARELSVTLTPAGTHLRTDLRDLRDRVMRGTGLSPDALRTLKQTLRNLTANLHDMQSDG